MSRPLRRAVALAVSALAGAAGMVAVVGVAPTGADPIGDCSTTTGVVVAVDFTTWGGNIERGCDATPTTGYDALHVAGFATAGDVQDGPGFICRIDDEPSPAADTCVATPPADASWSYWHADAGQNTWTYSGLGAMNYHPPPGSVDAWTFGSADIGTDGQPTFPPDSVRATGSTTTTTGPPTSTAPPSTAPADTVPSLSPPTAGTGGGRPAAVGTPAPSSPPGTGPGAADHDVLPTSVPTTTQPAPAGGPAATPKIVEAAPVATDRPSAGSPAGVLVGGAVVLALAAAAVVVARRRRRGTG